jgi:hypothetical protein
MVRQDTKVEFDNNSTRILPNNKAYISDSCWDIIMKKACNNYTPTKNDKYSLLDIKYDNYTSLIFTQRELISLAYLKYKDDSLLLGQIIKDCVSKNFHEDNQYTMDNKTVMEWLVKSEIFKILSVTDKNKNEPCFYNQVFKELKDFFSNKNPVNSNTLVIKNTMV